MRKILKFTLFTFLIRFLPGVRLAIVLVYLSTALRSGAQTADNTPVSMQSPAEKGLFDSDDLLHFTLTGPVQSLLKDRIDKPKKYDCLLSLENKDSLQPGISVEVSTRGHFRRSGGNCTYPPLMLRFPKDGTHKTTVFGAQKKLKLVMPCADDNYLVREWLVYKIYNLVTPLSFRARLVRVTLADSKSKKERGPFYGILIEEEAQMATRNKMITVKRKMKPQHTQSDAFLRLAVFEYLIGNTDWSVQFLQNTKLLAADSTTIPIAVPYDFDHAGIVDAPYAGPPTELNLHSVRERRYRGYCMKDMAVFEPVIADYNRLKNDIYGIYTGCALLEPKYLKTTLRYLDAFYETINNPKSWKKEFAYPCDPSGTGNVIIKGLKQE